MVTRRCRCCHAEVRITDCRNVRAWILPFLYGLMAEHDCGSTLAWVMWELPDELLVQDGEASPLSHELDTREVA